MKKTIPFLISILGVAAAGCASTTPVTPATTTTPPSAVVQDSHAQAPAASVSRVFELPGTPGAGTPREVKMLVELPELKVATIILRKGTVLPPHNSKRQVTIVALQGAGTVTAGTETFRIDATHAVVLAPGVQHEVAPDAATDLVLLVHHAGAEVEQHQ